MASVQGFGPNPGQMEMLSYVPTNLAPNAPLVVVLHGCTQTAEAYATNAGWLTLADRFGFVVVAAQQTSINNPNRCFNWFSPGDVARGAGEAASIASMVGHAVRTHDLDAERVFVTGLSAGGAMATAMLAVYPDVFAGGAVIAGLPYGVARTVQDALRVMSRPDGRSAGALGALLPARRPGRAPPRLSIWHGDADHTVQFGNGHDLAQQWTALHALPSAPHRVEPKPYGTRSTWRAGPQEVAIELNLVRGMGHGTPLSTHGADAVGAIAPYMLEAGISSTLEITRFWGIAGETSAKVDHRSTAMVRSAQAAPDQELRASGSVDAAGLGQTVMQAVRHVPSGVQDIIAKALRTAGLLK
jgi:poly(hydroxyalkanoate) depolymerase family esterase